MLAGHIDTVPHAANFPSQWDSERLRLTGVGTSDMKAGVAVQLRLAATLPEPNRDVTYVFYECEEVDAARNGLYLLSRDAPELLVADFAVLLEPSGGVVEGGCQGTLRAAITASGRAGAHGPLLDGEERDPRGGRDPGRPARLGSRASRSSTASSTTRA